MKKIFITLLVMFGIVMSGFSKQYVRVYTNYGWGWEDVTKFTRAVADSIQSEINRGSRVISMIPTLSNYSQTGHATGSTTYHVIVVFDDGKN